MAPLVFSSNTGMTVSVSFSLLAMNIIMIFTNVATEAPTTNLKNKIKRTVI